MRDKASYKVCGNEDINTTAAPAASPAASPAPHPTTSQTWPNPSQAWPKASTSWNRMTPTTGRPGSGPSVAFQHPAKKTRTVRKQMLISNIGDNGEIEVYSKFAVITVNGLICFSNKRTVCFYCDYEKANQQLLLYCNIYIHSRYRY